MFSLVGVLIGFLGVRWVLRAHCGCEEEPDTVASAFAFAFDFDFDIAYPLIRIMGASERVYKYHSSSDLSIAYLI